MFLRTATESLGLLEPFNFNFGEHSSALFYLPPLHQRPLPNHNHTAQPWNMEVGIFKPIGRSAHSRAIIAGQFTTLSPHNHYGP